MKKAKFNYYGRFYGTLALALIGVGLIGISAAHESSEWFPIGVLLGAGIVLIAGILYYELCRCPKCGKFISAGRFHVPDRCPNCGKCFQQNPSKK